MQQSTFEQKVTQEDLEKISYINKLDSLDQIRKNKFRSLLFQLSEMGFLDFDRNLRTAEKIGVDINQVMEELSKPEVKAQLLPMPQAKPLATSANQG